MRQSLIALRLAERLGLDETTRGGRVLRRLDRLGRLSRRRVRAGEVVRGRRGAQGRRSPRGHGRRAREGVRHEPCRRWEGLDGAGSPGRRVRRRRAARRQRDDGEPLPGEQRAGRSARTRREGARKPLSDVRALGRQGGAGKGQGRGDPHAGAPGEPRGRRRGLPPDRRGGGGGRGRSGAQRLSVRPGAGGRLLCRRAAAVQRDRLADGLAGGDRRGTGARDRALRRRARVRAGGDRRLHRPEVAVDDRPLARRGRPRARGHEDLRAVGRRRQARAQGGAGA